MAAVTMAGAAVALLNGTLGSGADDVWTWFCVVLARTGVGSSGAVSTSGVGCELTAGWALGSGRGAGRCALANSNAGVGALGVSGMRSIPVAMPLAWLLTGKGVSLLVVAGWVGLAARVADASGSADAFAGAFAEAVARFRRSLVKAWSMALRWVGAGFSAMFCCVCCAGCVAGVTLAGFRAMPRALLSLLTLGVVALVAAGISVVSVCSPVLA